MAGRAVTHGKSKPSASGRRLQATALYKKAYCLCKAISSCPLLPPRLPCLREPAHPSPCRRAGQAACASTWPKSGHFYFALTERIGAAAESVGFARDKLREESFPRLGRGGRRNRGSRLTTRGILRADPPGRALLRMTPSSPPRRVNNPLEKQGLREVVPEPPLFWTGFLGVGLVCGSY